MIRDELMNIIMEKAEFNSIRSGEHDDTLTLCTRAVKPGDTLTLNTQAGESGDTFTLIAETGTNIASVIRQYACKFEQDWCISEPIIAI